MADLHSVALHLGLQGEMGCPFNAAVLAASGTAQLSSTVKEIAYERLERESLGTFPSAVTK